MVYVEFLVLAWLVMGGLSAISACEDTKDKELSGKQVVFLAVLGLPMWLLIAGVLLPIIVPLALLGYLGHLTTAVLRKLG